MAASITLAAKAARSGYIWRNSVGPEYGHVVPHDDADAGRNSNLYYRGFLTFDASAVGSSWDLLTVRLRIPTTNYEGAATTWSVAFYHGVTLDLADLPASWVSGNACFGISGLPEMVDHYIYSKYFPDLINGDDEIVFRIYCEGDTSHYIWLPAVDSATLAITYNAPGRLGFESSLGTSVAKTASLGIDTTLDSTLAPAAALGTSLASAVTLTSSLGAEVSKTIGL